MTAVQEQINLMLHRMEELINLTNSQTQAIAAQAEEIATLQDASHLSAGNADTFWLMGESSSCSRSNRVPRAAHQSNSPATHVPHSYLKRHCWTNLCVMYASVMGTFVFLMQAGFGLLEAGAVQVRQVDAAV